MTPAQTPERPARGLDEQALDAGHFAFVAHLATGKTDRQVVAEVIAAYLAALPAVPEKPQEAVAWMPSKVTAAEGLPDVVRVTLDIPRAICPAGVTMGARWYVTDAHPISPALVGDEASNAEKWGFDAHDATEMLRLAEGAPVRREHYLVFQRVAAHLAHRVPAPRLAEVEAAIADVVNGIETASDSLHNSQLWHEEGTWDAYIQPTLDRLLALLGPAGVPANGAGETNNG